VFGHADQGASCGDTRAAGKQVLSNGSSSLAGTISPTAVRSDRWGAVADARRFAEGAAWMIAQSSLLLAPRAGQVLA